MNNRVLTIGGLLALVAVVIGAAVYIFMTADKGASGTAIASTVEEALAPKPDDIWLGDPNAPIKMVEYASSGCVHCAHMALQTMPKVKENYIDKGLVYYVLRDFPLNNVAAGGSLIARCLPKEKFYAFMDVLFANQNLWHSPDVPDPKEALIELARRAGLSREQTEACLANKEALARMNEILTEGTNVLKIQGTPTTFLNGERFNEAIEYEALDKKLQELLAAKKPN